MLEAHGLTNPFNALQVFPGGWMRRAWLLRQHDRIFGHDKPVRGRGASDAGRRPAQDQAKIKPNKSRDKSPPAPAAEAPPGLPLIDVDIPFSAELDLAPLVTAMRSAPESDGGWHGLRERFAHLGLAQGFDELLCLPHLRDIETLWYQVETVRKVLKQFRGRVLLADEVGLGKTIKAAVVLKEYLLRGMVDSVLVARPGVARRAVAGGARDQVRHSLRDHPRRVAAQRPRSPVLEPEMPDRFACAGASERTCRALDRPQLRPSHR